MVCINRERLLQRVEDLGLIGFLGEGKGISRFAWTNEYKEAAFCLMKWMQEIGLETRIDTVGNIYGRLSGKDGLPAVLTGSHLDTVPGGGRYDGAAGILCALEAVQTIKEQGLQIDNSIEIVAFINEEATQFLGGCMGSKAMCGLIANDYADNCIDRNTGKSLREAMNEFGMGLDPDRIAESSIDASQYKVFVELHIEQGTWLLENGYQVAVVDDVAGIHQLYLTFKGKAAHAGGMSMKKRQDAFMAAAETACALEQTIEEMGTDARGTVGYVNVTPNEHNIIPSEVTISVDIREVDDYIWEKLHESLISSAASSSEKRGVVFEEMKTLSERPCHCRKEIRDSIEAAMKRLGYPPIHMVSYPAHDSMQMGKKMPVGMIFLRSSNNGMSHCPEEYTLPEDMEAGANVLLHTLLDLSRDQ